MASSRPGSFQPLPVPDLPPPGSSSSSYRPSLFAPPQDDGRQRTFRLLKPVCVELLASSLLTPQTLPNTLRNLGAVYDILAAVADPEETVTPSLLSYIFFPVSQILQRNPPAALPAELRLAILRVLGELVQHWRGADAVRVREQVWRLAVGWWKSAESLGGGEEAAKVWVHVVQSCAVLPDDGPFGADDDARQLSTGMRAVLDQEAFLPVLGETFSVLIGLAMTGPSPAPPLSLLSLLLKTYYVSSSLTPHRQRILATILPGATSTLCKLVSPVASDRGGKGVRSEVVVLALAIVQDLLVLLFRDSNALGPTAASAGISDLGDLKDWVADSDDVLRPAAPSSPTPSNQSLSSLASAASTADTALTTPSLSLSSPQAQLVVLTPSWSTFTLHQLHPALVSLTHLRRHQHPNARRALADLSSTLLLECPHAFEESWAVLTGNLLVLAGDDYPTVSAGAREGLSRSLQTPAVRVLLLPCFRQHLMDALFTLPFLLRSPAQTANDKILASCRLVAATASVPELGSLVEGILGPLGGVEKWAEGLLDCLEFAPVGATETAGSGADRRAELAWSDPSSSARPAAASTSAAEPRMLRLSNIGDPTTERAVTDILSALGAAGGEDALFAVEHFISLASSAKTRSSMRSVAGVWCAERVLEGVAVSVESAESRRKGKGKAAAAGRSDAPGKRLRKTMRSIVRTLVEREAEDDYNVDEPADASPGEELHVGAQKLADTLMPTEYVKGLNPLSTLLDRPSPQAAGGSPIPPSASPEVVRVLRTTQTLSLLILGATILSTGFRPLLLHTLYFLLSHLSSPAPAVSSAALDAITRIAYHTGYASAQNLVLENSDYVINVVSQRLTSQRLDQAAPAVLISMIHLVGGEIVPLVHDIVDEIFDALDAYHGYEVLASTLLAVLDALLKVMVDETRAIAEPARRTAYVVPSEQPDPARDVATLKDWYLHRHDRAKEEIEEIRSRPPAPAEPTPHEPWGEDPDAEEPAEPQEADTSLPDADGPAAPKPTRSQDICAQILAKALFFLTHSSPFLRARVLSLFRSAILVLASAGLEAQLLPIVNRAWPYILNRASDAEPYVVLEALRVLEVLAGECGDFVAGRVRDEGWPLIRRLLQRQMDANRQASLVLRNRSQPSSGAANPLHGSPTSPFSTAHRLYAAALGTLTAVVSHVPVTAQIRWEILLLARPFLDKAVHAPLQKQARLLLVALDRVDPDAVWAGLTATIASDETASRVDEERMGWLREVGWDVADEAQIVLGSVA